MQKSDKNKEDAKCDDKMIADMKSLIIVITKICQNKLKHLEN